MAFTIYQYETMRDGQPLEPATTRTASQALGASVRMAAGTVYVAVVPDAAMYLRIDPATAQAATAADHKLAVGTTYGFPVSEGARPYLYGLAA